MGLHDDQPKRGVGLLGSGDGVGMRDGGPVRVGTVQDRKGTGAFNSMSDGEVGGVISAGVLVFIGILLKLRTLFSSSSKQVAYDNAAANWQADRQKELDEMRSARDKAWEQRVKDGARIAQLEAEVQFLQYKNSSLETRISVLEGKKP